jgi:hypothetical protein
MPNSLARTVYLIAFAEAAAGVLVALWLWPSADAVPSGVLNYARGWSIATAVGGVLGAVITYAIAETLDRVSALQDRTDMILHRVTRIDERLEQQALTKRKEAAAV